MIEQALNIIPGQPVLSAGLIIILIPCILYFARKPVHNAVFALTRVLYEVMRITAKSVKIAETKLIERNRDVLLAEGEEYCEGKIEQEFSRVNKVVERDLGKFPVLQRALFDQINRIDEDYQNSSDLVPEPPEWVEAVEAVAKLKETKSGITADILARIHDSILLQKKESIDEYRKSISKHHLILNKLMPYWRRLSENLEKLEKTINGIKIRSGRIDEKMNEYEGIRNKTDEALRVLKTSSVKNFILSGFALAIVIAGVAINFHLIAVPMSEMVGGSSYIGNLKTSDVAALVIILLEVSMGFYLMDALRVTSMFPVIGHMDDNMRKKMIIVSFIFLTILAGIESSLALMREHIVANKTAMGLLLTEGKKVETASNPIILAGQMTLGFILPFLLSFTAIAFEFFVQSCRIVFGSFLVYTLQFISYIFRVLGNISVSIGKLIVCIYDLIIFPALWIEDLVKRKPATGNTEKEAPEVENA